MKWTDEEVAILRAEFPHHPEKVVARKLGRSHFSVRQKAYKLGLSGPRAWSVADTNYLRRYYHEQSNVSLGRALNRSAGAVCFKLASMGLKRPKGSERLVISVSLPKWMVNRVDEVRRITGKSRSQVVRELLEPKL